MLGLVSYHRGTHYSRNYVSWSLKWLFLSSFHSKEVKIWPPLTKLHLTCLYAGAMKRDVVWTTHRNWILCVQWAIPHASVNPHEVPKTWELATRNYLCSGNKSDRRIDIYVFWAFLIEFDANKHKQDVENTTNNFDSKSLAMMLWNEIYWPKILYKKIMITLFSENFTEIITVK